MESIKPLKILIAAGGSGGHLIPAQQLHALLKKDCHLSFAGHRLKDSPFFQQEAILYEEIPSAPLNRTFFVQVFKGLLKACRYIRAFQPDLVVGFGSYHTFSVLLAAVLMRKKIVLFEANIQLGKVNRFFYLFANWVAVQFPPTKSKTVFVKPLPWIPRSRESLSPQEARIRLGLDPNQATVLVMGGSQGALFLNQKIPAIIDPQKMQVVHLTGMTQEPVVYAGRAVVKPFEPNMELAYRAADLAICRSGAGTLSELVRYQVPALLIPFPFASDGHQTKNAQFFVQHVKGGRMLHQKDASSARLLEELSFLMSGLESYQKGLANYFQHTQGRVGLDGLIRMTVRRD